MDWRCKMLDINLIRDNPDMVKAAMEVCIPNPGLSLQGSTTAICY